MTNSPLLEVAISIYYANFRCIVTDSTSNRRVHISLEILSMDMPLDTLTPSRRTCMYCSYISLQFPPLPSCSSKYTVITSGGGLKIYHPL